jgi:ribonuclease III
MLLIFIKAKLKHKTGGKFQMRNKRDRLGELEDKIGIGFIDRSLLEVSVTHSSCANQKKDVKYNERLEFLGDSVLQLCITEHLFTNYNNKTEGELTKIRSLIVCENSLYEIAQRWNLGIYMNMSKGEELTGGRNRVSILADCVEALIAAIYLDKGIETARRFILENFALTIKKAIEDEIVLDYKTKLQEVLQKNGEVGITYELVKFDGPPHRRTFYTNVLVNNRVMGEGYGHSKKEAEQLAAKEALVRMEDKIE